MSVKEFNISDPIDVSYSVGLGFAKIHLFTGQFVNISKDVIDQMYAKLQPLQTDHQRGRKVEAIPPWMYNEVPRPIESYRWPDGLVQAPVWHTADGRHIPVTEMDDMHIANAARRMSGIKNSSHISMNMLALCNKWLVIFQREQRRRNGK